MNRKILVGAIRWDAWYGHDGVPESVISQVEATLSPRHYHHRAPFYAQVTPDDKIIIPKFDQEIFDREMEYAIDAGIDYFTFVWYNDDMKKSRALYENSKYNDKVKMSVCMQGNMNENAKRELIHHFKQSYYQTVCDGRPLVYYFCLGTLAKRDIAALKEACEKEGIKAPYSVVMNIGFEDTVDSGADAIGRYGIAGCNGMKFSQLRTETCRLWEEFRQKNFDYVVEVSGGWHSLPRYETPVKWLKVDNTAWAEYPTGQDLYEHLTEALEYMQRPEVEKLTPAGTVQIYAWNEHDEGGWISPTIAVDENGRQLFDEDGKPKANTERLDGIKRAISEYRRDKL